MSSTCSEAPSEAPATRITEGSYQYMQAFHGAYIDTRAFNSCVTLKGSSNYSDWEDSFKICARQAGCRSLFNGTETAPAMPDEEASIEDWNHYMLRRAQWLGRNESMIGHLQSTLEPFLQDKVENCTLVAEALAKLEDECPERNFIFHLEKMSRLSEHTLKEASSFAEFQLEFERLYRDHNRTRGPPPFPEEFKIAYYLNALGPRLQPWVQYVEQTFKIDGLGHGPPLSFAEVVNLAEAQWHIWTRDGVQFSWKHAVHT